jgi:hypothetical protein
MVIGNVIQPVAVKGPYAGIVGIKDNIHPLCRAYMDSINQLGFINICAVACNNSELV